MATVALLLVFVMSAQAQVPTSVLIARKDSLSVSGSIMYPPGSGQYIQYVLTHNMTAQTVDVQINALRNYQFIFSIVDTAFNAVDDTGSVHSGAFTRLVDVSTLNSGSSYLTFFFYVRYSNYPVPELHTTLK